ILTPTRLIRGDREFGGNGPRIDVRVQFIAKKHGAQIDARVTMRAAELGGDGSETRQTFYDFPVWHSGGKPIRVTRILQPDWRVSFTSPRGQNPFAARGSCRDAQVTPRGFLPSVTVTCRTEDGGHFIVVRDRGPIRQMLLMGDTSGDDISTDNNPRGDTGIRGIKFGTLPVEVLQKRPPQKSSKAIPQIDRRYLKPKIRSRQ
ncbi:MAG: hypothetical protein AAGF15_11930, partial [Pseudomonadota bacterium]